MLAAIAIPGAAAEAADGLAGKWRGGGLVQSRSGEQERVKCRADIRPALRGQYRVAMKCVSRTKGAHARSFLVRPAGAGRFGGRFHDAETNIDVTAAIRLRGRNQTIELTSKQGWGRIELMR